MSQFDSVLDAMFGNKDDIVSLVRAGKLVEAAKYVDGPVVMMVRAQAPDLLAQVTADPAQFNLWNSASLGSIAYVALYAKDTHVRQAAMRSLNQYIAWHDNH